MDLIPYGSPPRAAFVTNVGLITSNGPHGHNIMSAEWTYQLSYSPTLLGVSIGLKKATHDNIAASKYFGVSIASTAQNALSSLAGGGSGKEFDKIAFLKSLGFEFTKAETFDLLMPAGAVMQAECKLTDTQITGDHALFIGEVVALKHDPAAVPIVYHLGKYWNLGQELPKPSPEQREEWKKLREKFRKA